LIFSLLFHYIIYLFLFRGTEIKALHGMPPDLVDRLLIIRTRPYEKVDIKDILTIRAHCENIPIEEDALDELAKIGTKTSLRCVY
jgi:DNA helicase TIP49 (TBP-interacting protein)